MRIKTRLGKLLKGTLGVGAGLLITTSVLASSTIWAPTDLDVQIAFTTPSAPAGIVGLFDDNDGATGSETMITGTALLLADFDLVTFATGSPPDYTATNLSNNNITLTDTMRFVLGFSVDGGSTWMADTAFIDHGNNVFTVVFDNVGTTVAIDVVDVMAPVPVPAAIWLFGSGLLGFAGACKRSRQRAEV